jgi:glycosyltransferase involved in cell wall biosynthesis
MRIGFDAKRLYCNFTGLGNYSRTLVKNLVTFFPDEEYFLYSPKIVQSPVHQFFLANESLHSHIYGGPLKFVWRSSLIKKRLTKDRLDLYHGLSNELPFNLKSSGIRSIVTIHDLIFKVYPGTYPLIDRQIYDFKFRRACEQADRIIAISESTSRDIVKFYEVDPQKIEVIYQSCHPVYYEKDESTRDNLKKVPSRLPPEYLLYVGSVIHRKNLGAIVRAYEHLPPDLRLPLVVVGSGKRYKKEVREMVRDKDLEDLVFWLEDLHDPKLLRAIYQAAQVLIYPSYYEGFGLPVAEALLCGTPVITSKLSSMPEAGGPASLYVDPENAEELAQAIEKVLTDPVLRSRMMKEGLRYAGTRFSPETVTTQLVKMYSDICTK